MDFERAPHPLIYRFRMVWNIYAPVSACWDALVARRAWAAWFPDVMLDGDAPWNAQVADSFGLLVRAPYGATIRVRLEVVAVTPGSKLVLVSRGDLAGYAVVRFCEQDSGKRSGCRVNIEWHVAANSRFLRWGSVLGLRPVFAWAHGRVMARALAAIRQELEADH